jgi:hypothetical protein
LGTKPERFGIVPEFALNLVKNLLSWTNRNDLFRWDRFGNELRIVERLWNVCGTFVPFTVLTPHQQKADTYTQSHLPTICELLKDDLTVALFSICHGGGEFSLERADQTEYESE